MKITNLESGTPFSMGKGQNWSVLNPDSGAETITLNHALHAPGHEFTQHFHDDSEDIIVVLEGEVSLRQGHYLTSLVAGEAARVPAGEVHGTVNTGEVMARLISFQIPPDLALYKGERNKADKEVPRPRDGSTSAVSIAALSKGGPLFGTEVEVRSVFSPERGSPSVRLDHLVFGLGKSYSFAGFGKDMVLVVLHGTVELSENSDLHDLNRHDVVHLSDGESVMVSGTSKELAVLIACSSQIEKESS